MMGKYKSYSTPNALRLDLPSSIRLAAFVICSMARPDFTGPEPVNNPTRKRLKTALQQKLDNNLYFP